MIVILFSRYNKISRNNEIISFLHTVRLSYFFSLKSPLKIFISSLMRLITLIGALIRANQYHMLRNTGIINMGGGLIYPKLTNKIYEFHRAYWLKSRSTFFNIQKPLFCTKLSLPKCASRTTLDSS